MIKNLLQVSVFIFFCSCSTKYKQEIDTEIESIKIEIDGTEKLLNMSEIIDSIRYVRLDTDADNLIGDISKLIPLKDKIIIVDQTNAQTIFLFDNKGSYLSKIANCGMGPQEYARIGSVTVDEEGDRVFIFDSGQHKILIYSTEGEYLESITPDFFLREIEYVGEDVLACYCGYFSGDERMLKNSKTPLVLLYNLKNNKTIGYCYESISITATETVLPYQTLCRYSNTGAVFYYPLNEYIYDVNSHKINATYKVVFSEENDKLRSGYIKRLQSEIINPEQLMPGGNARENFYNLSGAMKGDDFLLIGYLNRDKAVNGMGIFYQKSKRFVYGHSDERYPVRNDIDGGYPLIPTAVMNNQIYTVIDAGYLEQLDTTSPELKQYQQSLTSDDNPIIMISMMKNK